MDPGVTGEKDFSSSFCYKVCTSELLKTGHLCLCVYRCKDWDLIDSAQKARLELAKVEDGEFW